MFLELGFLNQTNETHVREIDAWFLVNQLWVVVGAYTCQKDIFFGRQEEIMWCKTQGDPQWQGIDTA